MVVLECLGLSLIFLQAILFTIDLISFSSHFLLQHMPRL